MSPPSKNLVVAFFALTLALVALISSVHTKRNLREREFSRQWESNYVSMKAAFDTMDDVNKRLEFRVLNCQTNFQAVVDALAWQKSIKAK